MRLDEQQIFDVARKIDAGTAREAYLQQACGDDAALGQRVRALLQAYEAGASFLEPPIPALAATTDEPAREGPGLQIGPYKLMEQIGEGGMGLVFVAAQHEPVRRKVALKLIKPGMASREIIARFEAERQALALMDHPNIARVLDAGATPSGRPYFVMELVKGMPITQFCDDNRLTPRERLELFTHVCHAVQHAHQKGIIHRDIKPSNLLVASHDGRPVVKVIDFGVAKAVGQQLTEKTVYTNLAQMVGTPLYMSPEQAGMSGLDIDTRTDIYSLGVLLYELLTGTTPFDKARLKQAAYDEMRRIIREEEPQKPSTRISATDAAPSIAACRHTEPSKLAKLVRGDLDWIVMKALEKDRSRRYETANGFAADVVHYLADEPVLACPPSTAYRFRKFARRSKAALATASVVAAVLVLGTAVSTWQAIRATKAENLAQSRLESEKRAAAKEATARQDAESNLGKARHAVQQMLTRVAEERLAYIPQVEEVRSKLFEDALRFYEELLQQKDVDPAIRLEAALARLRVGNMSRVLGRHSEGEEHCLAAITIMQRLCQEQPQSEAFQVVLSDGYQGLGEVLAADQAGPRTAEAEQALAEAIRLRSELAVRSSKNPNHRQRQSVSYRWLARALTREPTRKQDAAAACRKAIEISQRLVSEFPSSPDYLAGLASAHCTLCSVLVALKQPEAAQHHVQQAITLFERLEMASPDIPGALGRELGTTHQGLAGYRHDFASAYCNLGDWLGKNNNREEAAAAFGKGLAIYERLVTDFPSVPLYRVNLAANLTKWSTFLESGSDKVAAESASLRAMDLYGGLVQQFPTNDNHLRSLLSAAQRLVRLLNRRGASSESLAVLRRIRELFDAFPDNPAFRQAQQRAYQRLISTLIDVARRPAEAEPICREQIARAEKLVAESGGVPADLRLWGDLLFDLGRALMEQIRVVEAAEAFRQDVDVLERLVATAGGIPDDRLRLEEAYTSLGFALKLRGSHEEAIAAHRQALALAEKLTAEFPEVPKYLDRPTVSHWRLAGLLRATGRHDQAEEHYQQVLGFYEMHPEREDLSLRGEALIGLAHIFSQRGQSDKAAETYEQVPKINPVRAYDNYHLAWLLSTCEEPKFRDPGRAVEFAKKAVDLTPQDRIYLLTLGVAQYRAGDWKAASEALDKSTALGQGGDAYTWFFLAMTHWQLDQKKEARQWYAKAVEWMEKNANDNKDLRRFRAEADELMKAD